VGVETEGDYSRVLGVGSQVAQAGDGEDVIGAEEAKVPGGCGR
jgi:hypothetical protein